jgi:transcriptional regulator with XRE-family HTH domain
LQSSFKYTSREIIGQRIKFFREKNNLTQQELADLINSERQYVSKLEHGKKNMTLDNLDRIISALKCKQEDFLNTTPNP